MQLEAMTAQIKSLLEIVTTLSKSIAEGVSNNNGNGASVRSGGGGSGSSHGSGSTGNKGSKAAEATKAADMASAAAAAEMAMILHSMPHATWELTAQPMATIPLVSTTPVWPVTIRATATTTAPPPPIG